MESVQGSWQYESISSAIDTSLPASPSSPTMYNQLSPYHEQGMWDDYNLTKMEVPDPFIGSGGEQQLLSATGDSTINCFSPTMVLNEMDEQNQSTLLVDPKVIQPLPIGEPTTVDLRDLEHFLGEINFTSVVKVDQTAAQDLVDVKAEELNEASFNLGSPLLDNQAEVQLEDVEIFGIEGVDVIPEDQLYEVLGNGEALSFDQWAVDEDGDVYTSSGTYEASESAMNEDSYIDSDSHMSSVMSSDAEDELQEDTIDALISNNLPAAQASILNSNFVMPATSYIVEQTQTERRGRKPTSSTSTKSWRNVKDKGLRKKEQNKLAATKYRQKKKEEAKVSMVEESTLQADFNKLTKTQQSLADKIRQVKELLKEKYNWNSD